MSLISNKFEETLTRGPGLMRYGYFHSLNNYISDFSMAYTVHTASKIYAENCYYEDGGNVICDWNTVTYPGSYAESGSTFVSCNRTTIEGYAQDCTWHPTSNYTYTSLTAENAKVYCATYSGCQSAKENMMYLRYATSGVPSAGYVELPDETVTIANFSDGAAYRIKNVNSGLYLQVTDGTAENGANVQQWGSDGTAINDIWKFYSAGDGYYYIVSAVGDGGTYVLDVTGKKTTDGTNIDIYQYNGGTNQQFMLIENTDGSYCIYTGITDGASVVEVTDASTASGANVQQWVANGATCQEWILESAEDPGCAMDTDVIYTFENANSGFMMDITDGEMAAGVNVQQWEQSDADAQKFVLKTFGSENYYWIRSYQDENYALTVTSNESGGNIELAIYNAKDSAQLFRFTKNIDGTYGIITHASQDLCYVEVADASLDYGANVQQWTNTNHACQKWNLLTSAITTTTTTTEATTETTTTTTTTITAASATTTTETETETETETTTTSDIADTSDVTEDTTITTTVSTTTTTVTTTETTTTVSTDLDILIGDINLDGTVSLADVVKLSKYVAGSVDLTVAALTNSDVDDSNYVDADDALILLKFQVQLIDTLPYTG